MPRIAIAIDPNTQTVSRFGHGNALMIVDEQGRVERRITPTDGCCAGHAASVSDCDMLIASGVGAGAIQHLQAAGIAIRAADEGADPAHVHAQAQDLLALACSPCNSLQQAHQCSCNH